VESLKAVGWALETRNLILETCMKLRIEATPAGFEPAISTVTGWHVRPLHQGALKINEGLNSQPNQKFIRDSACCQVESSRPGPAALKVPRVKGIKGICYNSKYENTGN
jgi:hypothetical protein